MSRTRYQFEAFVDEKMLALSRKPLVLDVGSSEGFSKWLAPYKQLFAGVVYKSLDIDPATGADIVGDIHAIPLPDDSVDAIICSSVLEHVQDPLRAASELRRILKPGGALFLYVPSIYPYHQGRNGYPDYWRFFRETTQQLCDGFSSVEFCKRGGYFLALSYFVPGQHRMRGFLDAVAYLLDRLFNTEDRSTTSGYYAYAVK